MSSPTWQELFPVIRGALPRTSDLDDAVARNVALAVEMHLGFRAAAPGAVDAADEREQRPEEVR